MRKENYITIQGFMITDLHLKGNELLVYALIYGFSQDGKSKFNASYKYISDWISTTPQTAINTINSLEDKGLIIKEQKLVDKVLVNEYYVSNCDEEKQIKKTEKQKRSKEFIPPTLEEVKEYFKSRNLTESSAKRFFDYYTIGCWCDGKGDKIKNWKQKVIAVWDKPDNREKTEQQIQFDERRNEEAQSTNMFVKNSSLISKIKTGNLILVNVVDILMKCKDRERFASQILQTMTERLLTDQELQDIKTFIEIQIRR